MKRNTKINILECKFNDDNNKYIYITYLDTVLLITLGIVKLTLYDNSPNSIWISDLYVYEDFQRQGIGNTLLLECEKYAKEHNIMFISLSVINKSWMHQWYNNNNYFDYFVNSDDGKFIQLIKTLDIKSSIHNIEHIIKITTKDETLNLGLYRKPFIIYSNQNLYKNNIIVDIDDDSNELLIYSVLNNNEYLVKLMVNNPQCYITKDDLINHNWKLK